MKVTKHYTELLVQMKNAAQIVAWLQSLEGSDETRSLLASNVITMARCSADGLLVLLRRYEKDLAGDNKKPPTVQGDLFPPTPGDRAATLQDLRRVVETWFNAAHHQDDTGRGGGDKDTPAAVVRDRLVDLGGSWPSVEEIGAWTAEQRIEVEEWAKLKASGESFEMPEVLQEWTASDEIDDESSADAPPEANLARSIKISIHEAGYDGLTDADLKFIYVTGDVEDDAVLDRVVWALIHTGEIEVERPGLIYRAETPELVLDIAAMLTAQPGLGTEEGLPEGQIVGIPIVTDDEVPDMVDVVSRFVHESGPITRLDVLDHFIKLETDEVEVSAALDYLVKNETLEQSDGRVARPGMLETTDDLDALEGDALRELFVEETNRKPGRKRDETLRKDIREARAAKAESAEDEQQAAEDDQPIEE